MPEVVHVLVFVVAAQLLAWLVLFRLDVDLLDRLVLRWVLRRHLGITGAGITRMARSAINHSKTGAI
jgi:hypothetical protein